MLGDAFFYGDTARNTAIGKLTGTFEQAGSDVHSVQTSGASGVFRMFAVISDPLLSPGGRS